MADARDRSLDRLLGITALFLAAFLAANQGLVFLGIATSAVAGGAVAVWASHRCRGCASFRTKVVEEFVPGDIQGPNCYKRHVHCFTCQRDDELPTKWDLADLDTSLT